MPTEDTNKSDMNAADDPFAGWAEALDEQKKSDPKAGDT